MSFLGLFQIEVEAQGGGLLRLLEGLPGRAHNLLVTGENLVKSFTCDDIDLFFPEPDPVVPHGEDTPGFPSPVEDIPPTSQDVPVLLEHAPKCAPWLLSAMVLMGLNSYFLQLPHVSSLWTPVLVAIPFLNWMVSWCKNPTIGKVI
ncbi:hypothetical protein DSO57_1028651 [Entomophthora muscae]|uniref:Uncharacterized protein n=1 Tax=Entomophthora muscae TaxID=34485 RepID=A0ACC2UMA4_9FUNG|nr:hypothetical protein DSO57_1028651 [Entomophthora muscae]